jgi:hypothetical protein
MTIWYIYQVLVSCTKKNLATLLGVVKIISRLIGSGQSSENWDRSMIKKIFSPKNLAKNVSFFSQTTASFCRNMTITLFLRKNGIFGRPLTKSQKIVIITWTSD